MSSIAAIVALKRDFIEGFIDKNYRKRQLSTQKKRVERNV